MSTFLILRDTTTNNKPTVYGRDWPVSAHKTAHLQVRKRDVFVVQEQTCPRCGPAASCAAVHGPHSAAASSNTHCANDNRWSLLQRGENKGEAEGKIEREKKREREREMQIPEFVWENMRLWSFFSPKTFCLETHTLKTVQHRKLICKIN